MENKLKQDISHIGYHFFSERIRITRFEKTLIHLALLFSILALGVK